jgi:NhaA family Na+:H+ antiporter
MSHADNTADAPLSDGHVTVQRITGVSYDLHRFTTPAERVFERFLPPFESFIKNQTTSSLLLLFCAIVALILDNSPWRVEFNALFDYHFSFNLGGWGMDKTLGYWVNDGLMALFFFILGLEIKREMLVGEFRRVRRATLLIITAAGGMLVPALIFAFFNPTHPELGGWGIPMATDTAFAIGALALLGRRVPRSMIIFLAGLAIVDDIGGILVIALFYTKEINGFYLGVAAAAIAVLALVNWLGIRRPLPYVVFGIITWLAVLESGLHATLASTISPTRYAT